MQSKKRVGSFCCALATLFVLTSCSDDRAAQPPLAEVGPPPVPILDRPIDLAVFDAATFETRVKLDGATRTEGDFPALFSAAPAGPLGSYWTAHAPATIDIDLGRMCYVSSVVVYPFTENYGIGGCAVEVASDGIDRPVPVGQYNFRPASPPFDRPAPAATVAFFPKHTDRVRIHFPAGAPGNADRIYLRKIRVLGVPGEGPPHIEQTPASTAAAKTTDAPRINVVQFDVSALSDRVAVSEDRMPNGNSGIPWIDTPQGAPSDNEQPYWCATAPAWVSIDLGRACIVDEVIVDGFTQDRGIGPAYVKLVDDSGKEHDTVPPGDLVAIDSRSSVRFEPRTVQRLKLYFSSASPEEQFVYVRKIQVLGVPVEDPVDSAAAD